jgi:hypothetical protein
MVRSSLVWSGHSPPDQTGLDRTGPVQPSGLVPDWTGPDRTGPDPGMVWSGPV